MLHRTTLNWSAASASSSASVSRLALLLLVVFRPNFCIVLFTACLQQAPEQACVRCSGSAYQYLQSNNGMCYLLMIRHSHADWSGLHGTLLPTSQPESESGFIAATHSNMRRHPQLSQCTGRNSAVCCAKTVVSLTLLLQMGQKCSRHSLLTAHLCLNSLMRSKSSALKTLPHSMGLPASPRSPSA